MVPGFALTGTPWLHQKRAGEGRDLLDLPRFIRNRAPMVDAEDCARQLRTVAAEPDTPEARHKIDACIDDYLVRGGVRLALAGAFEDGDVPGSTLTAFIRARLASEVG
jgi:hypothetical protein